MLDTFQNIVVADFEFHFGGHASFEEASRSGERPRPVCLVAKELRSGKVWRVWHNEFGPNPPFPIGCDSLFIAFYASAELGCFRALGWPKPANVLDLFTEFRDRANGLPTLAGFSLVGALAHFGLDAIATDEKDRIRLLIHGGGPWSESERKEILDYCATDTVALERLLPAMAPRIDLARALLRGRYMAAAAAMEFAGVPIDTAMLQTLRDNWDCIKDDLIGAIDAEFGVFDGRSFRAERWAAFLVKNNIPWPLLESGALDLSDGAFRQMAKAYPAISPMRELRSALSDLRLNDLAVSRIDGRNRTVLSAFAARTGRNQPSNTRFIFGPSVWLRGLIKPPPGHGVAYVDWAQQEFGIAAALSGDPAMIKAYQSGDPYLTFAKQANAVPLDATKKTHGPTRELFKQCVLAVQYGMGAESLACRIGQAPVVARDLLRAHRETYRVFWRWSDAALDHAMITGELYTVFGWHIHVGENPNPRSLRNFPMQANGSELLRLACCLGIERGIEVCAPVHDAVLICAPLDRIESDISAMRTAMAEASRIVLNGFELGTDVHVVKFPDRYMDARGIAMWDQVINLVTSQTKIKGVA